MTLQNMFGDLALDATLAATNDKLDSILTELGTKLDGGGTVALDSATLAALETISAAVTNWPTDFPDAAVLAKLETIRLLLAAGLTVQGSDGSTPRTLLTDSDGTLRVTSAAIAQDATMQDLVHLLGVIATRLGTNDGLGRMLVNIAGQAVAQSGTWTVTPANTANTTAWLTQNPAVSTALYGGQGSGLDQHYQSISAFTDAVRSKVTVS